MHILLISITVLIVTESIIVQRCRAFQVSFNCEQFDWFLVLIIINFPMSHLLVPLNRGTH